MEQRTLESINSDKNTENGSDSIHSHEAQIENNLNTSLNTSMSGSQNEVAARIGLNDNKAGMEGLDKEKINKIIIQASKGKITKIIIVY